MKSYIIVGRSRTFQFLTDFSLPVNLHIRSIKVIYSRPQKSRIKDGWSSKQKKTTDCKQEEDWWGQPHQTIERWFGQVTYRGWANVRYSADEVISSESQSFQEDCRGKGKILVDYASFIEKMEEEIKQLK